MTLLIKYCTKSFFFAAAMIIISFAANSQSLQEIQNIQVDNLSDAQIEQLIKRAESSGMNEQQLISMALERGMPASEVAKLRQRIQQLRSGNRGTDLQPERERAAREVEGKLEQQ